VPSAIAVVYVAPFVAPRSWYRIPMLPFAGLTSTHGNHWSPPPASTRDGDDHEPPPFDELIRNTLVFVVGLAKSCPPFRLSANTR